MARSRPAADTAVPDQLGRTARNGATATPEGDEADGSRKAVGSVENALRLLLMFRGRRSIRVSEAAVELGVARSTAHRMLNVLLAYGFVEQDPASRAYGPGLRLVELGMSVARDTDILSIVHPFLERLSAATDETVHLMVLEGTDTRFVDSVESHNPLRVTARIGVVYPAYATSGGKVLLAELTDAEVRKLFPKRSLPALTDDTVPNRDELLAELEVAREQGFAINRGQSTSGISAVAAVVRDPRGRAQGAIAISAPDQRLGDDRLPVLVAELRKIVSEVSALLP
jgi:IclR family transcriptional regulator, acetate operon repressor